MKECSTYLTWLLPVPGFDQHMSLNAVLLYPIAVLKCMPMATSYAFVPPISPIAIDPLNCEEPLSTDAGMAFR